MNEKIFDSISGEYKIALLTTYNMDLDFFDNSIFYKFFVNGLKDVSVFIDFDQLQESLKSRKTNLGIRYSIIPIKMNKSFHPKVVLLLNETKAKLIVGSLNLTETGYSINQEIFNVFEYDRDNQENLNLIIDAYNFFIKLNELSTEKDNEIFKKCSEFIYLNRTNMSGEVYFINNLEKSIFESAVSKMEGTINRIDIAVPYYDNEASALAFLENSNPKAEIKLFIQNEKSTFPQKLYDKYCSKIFKFKRIKCNDSGNFYHGKVFRFITDKYSYILYGSANCTNAAFINSYVDNGNIECDILEKGTIEEFNSFFEEFEEDNNPFSSYPIIDKKVNATCNFTFDYIDNNDSMKIILKYKTVENNIDFFINDENVSDVVYEYKNDRLIVSLSSSFLKEIGNVFQLKILNRTSNFADIINCFYNDYESISNYRNYEENDKSVAKKILFGNDFFVNDVIDLMYQMPNNAVDVRRIKENEKLYNEQKIEIEESENDEEYIINEEVLLEYKKKFEEDAIINSAMHRIGNSYYNMLRDIIRFGDEEVHKNNTAFLKKNEDNIFIKCNIDVTPEELELFNRRKGKKIVNKIINGISKNDYLEEIGFLDYKAYLGLVGIFFDKYTDYRSSDEIKTSKEDKKEYLFDYKDVANSKMILYKSLLKLTDCTDFNKEQEKDDVITLCILAILQNIYSNEEYGIVDRFFKNEAKSMIKKLDELYYIRDSYANYVRAALKVLNYRKQVMSEGFAFGEIENLFDYKSIKRIRDLLTVAGEFKLNKNGKELLLEFEVNEVVSFVNLRLRNLINELGNYFKNKHYINDDIDSLVIIISNPNVNLTNPNPVINIKLIWDKMGYRKIKNSKLKDNEVEEEIKW